MLDREDVESLREEIADSCEGLADALAAVRATAGEAGREACLAYATRLKNVATGTRLVGSSALAKATTVLERNLGELPLAHAEQHRAVCDLLTHWPNLFLSYLEAPTRVAASAIVEHLSDPIWAAPLDANERDALLRLFAQDEGADAAPAATAVADEEKPQASESFDDEWLSPVAALQAGADGAQEDAPGGSATEHGDAVSEPSPDDLWSLCAADGESRDGVSANEGATLAERDDVGTTLDVDAAGDERRRWDDIALEPTFPELPTEAVKTDPLGDTARQDELRIESARWNDRSAPAVLEMEQVPSAGTRASPRDGAQEQLFAAFAAELSEVPAELEPALEAFATAADGDRALAEAIEQYEAVVERLASTCELLGLAGLQEVCGFVSANLLELAGQERSARAAMRERLHIWPALMFEHLRDPSDDAACKRLVRHLQEGSWPSALTDEAAHELLRRLVETPAPTAAETPEESRPTEALPEDIALQVPEDVNQEMVDVFLQEAPGHASEFSACMQKLYERSASKADVRMAQRAVHTLKGSSHLIGVRGIANLAHHVEDILEFLGGHAVSPPPPLVQTLVDASDCMEEMIDAVAQGAPPPAQALPVLQRVLGWALRVDKGAFREADVGTISGRSGAEAAAPSLPVVTSEQKATPSATADTPPQQVLRVPTRSVDELLRLVAELSTSITQLQDRYERAVERLRGLREQNELIQGRSYELEDLVEIRGVGMMQGQLRRTGTHGASFDPLELNQYNELHSITQGVIEAASDARELSGGVNDDLSAFEELLVRQERLNKMLQQAVMATRMVPVRSIVPRLERTVRQTCRATGKQAQLRVSGQDILIDGEVLQKLGDPLMHILRNAIDHGIESTEERLRLGKPEGGRIELHFGRMGNAIILRCEDDGRGLDYDKIRQTALERRLIPAGAEPTERDLGRLLFIPGFSTHSRATHTSGRGIGLDVVYSAVMGMKGSVEIASGEGSGCQISLRLPVSLITAHVLLVEVNSERYGVPTTNLEQILSSGIGQLERLDAGTTLQLGEERYPLQALASLLHLVAESADVNFAIKPVLLVRADAGVIGVAVDRVLGGRDLVIKGMGRYVKDVTGVLGAAVLGDGTAIPVLDVPELLRSPVQRLAIEERARVQEAAATAAVRVLIVDDSLSARRSLSELVSEAGYAPLLAKDGLEAVDVLQEQHPDIALVDLEMPRMNGLEFTAHVRAHEATANMPVIVITSRSTDKHRRQAKLAGATGYVTKPFDPSELLDLIATTVAQRTDSTPVSDAL